MAPIGPLPPQSVSEMVRQMGLEPVGAPVRSGPVYFQRAADYYGKPLRVVIDAHRAQVVSVEPVGGPPMMHGGPYASAGAPYWRRPYGYPYGMPDDEAIAPPGSVMTPHGMPPQGGLPPATQAKPAAKSAAVTPSQPPVPRKRPASAPQQAAGSVEPAQAATGPSPAAVEKPAAAAPPPAPEKPANAPEKPANALPPVNSLE
jgi:hypothetical protein